MLEKKTYKSIESCVKIASLITVPCAGTEKQCPHDTDAHSFLSIYFQDTSLVSTSEKIEEKILPD